MPVTTNAKTTAPHIGTLNERPLHAALKAWYTRENDQVEVSTGNYVVDIVRGDLLIEIQTKNFASIKKKMFHLVEHYPVRLVFPIALQKWILKTDNPSGEIRSRRKSPKRGHAVDVFGELVSFPQLLARHNFSLQLIMIFEEEVRRFDKTRAWRRRGWTIQERRLLRVVEELTFETPQDVLALVPDSLTEPFSTSDLAVAIARPRWLAQKMAYCLRKMGAIAPVGKRRNANLYARASSRERRKDLGARVNDMQG